MEEEKKQATVYVGEDDGIVEVIDKIRNISGHNVTLVIPDQSAILQDVTNLKILQKQAEEMGKDISISKAGILADAVAEAGKKAVAGAGQLRKAAPRAVRGRSMSDMVRKSGTVDLRRMASASGESPVLSAEAAKPEMRMQKDEAEASASKSDFFKEGYSRDKYFSEEALPGRKKTLNDFSLSEINPETVAKLETGEEKPEKKEISEDYWGNLAEEKLSERGEAQEQQEDTDKFEGIFDDRGRLDSEYDGKAFDFSYAAENKTKKKHSILPTLSSRFFAFFILLCVATAGLALYFILPEAKIAVALKQEEVKGDFTFTLDEKLTAPDADADKLPVKGTEIKSEKTQTFTTTSKKRVTEKAAGEIVIYNECSTGPQTLVAGTRFLSKDGKVFKLDAAVSVAGFTKPEDEVVPGQEVVKVTAEEAGESSNIQPTTFTIPKLQEQGSWKYSCLYARSEKAMTGGMDKEVAYVSQDDYDKAKATLLEAVKKENEEKISGQTDENSIFLDDKADEGTVEDKSSVEVGGLGESFDLTVTLKKSVFSVAKADMQDVLGKKILKLNTYADAKPVEGSIEYTLGDFVEKDKQLSLDVSAVQKFSFELDQDKIKREIGGKDKQELNEYFGKMEGIRSVSVNFWPFWVTRVPENADKIDLTVDSGQ